MSAGHLESPSDSANPPHPLKRQNSDDAPGLVPGPEPNIQNRSEDGALALLSILAGDRPRATPSPSPGPEEPSPDSPMDTGAAIILQSAGRTQSKAELPSMPVPVPRSTSQAQLLQPYAAFSQQQQQQQQQQSYSRPLTPPSFSYQAFGTTPPGSHPVSPVLTGIPMQPIQMQPGQFMDPQTGAPIPYGYYPPQQQLQPIYGYPSSYYPYGTSPGGLVAVVVPTNWAARPGLGVQIPGRPGTAPMYGYPMPIQQGQGQKGGFPIFPHSASLSPHQQQAMQISPPTISLDPASTPSPSTPSSASPLSTSRALSDHEPTRRATQHRRTTSGSSPGIKEKTKVFECDVCGKVLKSSGHYHRHRREVHEKKRDYFCSICNEAFSRQEHLSRHQSSHERGTSTSTGRPSPSSISPSSAEYVEVEKAPRIEQGADRGEARTQ